MNLADPTIGDLIDRLVILGIRHGGFNDDKVQEMRDLAIALEEKLSTAYMGGNAAGNLTYLVRAAAMLGAINGRLWEVHEHEMLADLPLRYAKVLNVQRREMASSLGKR